MKLYQVKWDQTVYWPNGEIRAESLEVFDLMTDIEPDEARRYMEALAMRGQVYQRACVAPQDSVPVERDMPDYMQRKLHRLGWTEEVAEIKTMKEPEAAPPTRKKRSRKRKPSEDADA
ncbi:MAG: hypothetical protein VW713_08285 [Alphaproteobacteria bacterium]